MFVGKVPMLFWHLDDSYVYLLELRLSRGLTSFKKIKELEYNGVK